MVLQLCPIYAFASEVDDTAKNVNKVLSYADQLRKANQKDDLSTGGLTWDTESKKDSWRYFNGAMMDAFTMIGTDEMMAYVAEFLADNTNSDGSAKNYHAGEVDSVPMALGMFELLDHKTYGKRFANAIEYVYQQLKQQTVLGSEYGNNYWHKTNSSSWTTWKFGLDGLYMACVFEMEYANAVEEGKLTSSVKPADIYKSIYNRLEWVASAMLDKGTGLYHHGWNGSQGNGHFWGRSVGWYAVALVDIIEMMPQGTYKQGLIDNLPALFDGMLNYQDAATGMWYNVINRNASLSSNKLESSATAMMAYALMKAYNNDWVGESYGEAGLKAFNGVVNNKLTGSQGSYSLIDTYKSSGVSTTDEDYTKNPYTTNEAKGVAPLIMAATVANATAGKLEAANAPAPTEPEATEPAPTEPAPTEPAPTEPAPTEPEATEPEILPVYQGTGNLTGGVEQLGGAASSITSGTYYYLVNTKANKTLTNTEADNRVALNGTQALSNVNRWYITKVSGNNYYVQYGGPAGKYLTVGNGTAALVSAPTALTLTYNTANSCWDIGQGSYHLNDYRGEHNYVSGYTADAASDNGSRWTFYPVTVLTTYYELDTNGIDYGSDNKYLIVAKDQAVALKPNGSNTTTQNVTIQDGLITEISTNLEWYFLKNSSKTGSTTYDTLITQNGNTWLYHTNTNMYIGNGNDAHRGYWKLDNYSNGNYCLGDQDYNIWYLYHNGSKFTVRSNNTSTYVRLFKKVTSNGGAQVNFNLAPSATQLKPNGTMNIAATVLLDGKAVDLNQCSIGWTSSNNAVLTVSDGVVTAVGNGTATVTVTLYAVNGTSLKNNIVLTVPVTVLGHDYTAVVTAPTCVDAGYTTYTCSICGDTYVAEETAALGHDYNAVVTAPTCVDAGFTTYTCACGDSYVANEVAALGHDYKAVVTAPTCETAGYTTYTCACGDSYVADEVAGLGHTYKAVVTAPTCETAGYTTYTCACGDSYVADEVAALGHNYISVVTEATCETDGFTTHTCDRCDDVIVDSVVAAFGHDFTTVTVDPTCTEQGSVTTTCGNCGKTTQEKIPALGHAHKTVVTAPTCVDAGYTTYTCTTCGDSYVADEVAALGHRYTEEVVDPTCESAGSVKYTCHCGHSYVEQLAALGHKYSFVVTAPTCVDAGYTTYTCACGDTYVGNEVAALGHDYKTVVTAPTCVDAGYTTYTCACGDTYVADEVAALGHTYKTVVTAPTCETAGYTTYTCACGDTYVADEVAALGHNHDAVVTAPTCLTAGYTTYTCACGNTYVADEVAALGHIYDTVVTDPTCLAPGYTTYTCACGDSYVGDEVAAHGHSYISDDSNGYLVHTCEFCGDEYTENGAWVAVSFARLSGEGIQNYNDTDGATVATVLDKLSVELSNDGVNVSGTLAVTADMVTWEQPFNGNAVGTYTAKVIYNGMQLGVIKVNVTTIHVYETVVVAPTCENDGYTETRCTECDFSVKTNMTEALGHSYTSEEKDGYVIYTCHCGDTYSEKSGPTYTSAETVDNGKSYVVTVTSNGATYALSHQNNTVSAVQVTVSGGQITSEITENMVWSCSGGKLSYVSAGKTYYLYTYNNGNWWWTSPALGISADQSSDVSFTNHQLKLGSYYLNYSNNAFGANSSATTVNVFLES